MQQHEPSSITKRQIQSVPLATMVELSNGSILKCQRIESVVLRGVVYMWYGVVLCSVVWVVWFAVVL